MTEVFDGEFKELEARLRRYQPAGPSAAAQQRTATVLRVTPRHTRRLVTLVAAAAVMALLAGLAWWMPRRAGETAAPQVSSIPEKFRTAWAAVPREPFQESASASPVTVVLFTDWECPPCLTLYWELKPILDRYERVRPRTVTFVVEDWPWNTHCNPEVPVTMHAAACDLAAAVRLARGRGREAEMVDWIRRNHDRLKDADAAARIRGEAGRLSGAGDIDRAFASTLATIQHSVSRHVPRGIRATPTVFVNGARLQTTQAEHVQWAIHLELARLGISEGGRWRSSK